MNERNSLSIKNIKEKTTSLYLQKILPVTIINKKAFLDLLKN
jgi:hypothetical protein